jgi:hypothetical protein
MKRIRLAVPALVAAIAVPALASPSRPVFDREMTPILTEYLVIEHALAADRLDGVKPAARAIVAATAHLKPVRSGHGDVVRYGSLPRNIAQDARSLAAAKDLTSARTAFLALGKHLVVWVITAHPRGARVLYCPMVKATWVENGKGVHNPYLGRAHEHCGRVMVGDRSR